MKLAASRRRGVFKAMLADLKARAHASGRSVLDLPVETTNKLALSVAARLNMPPARVTYTVQL